jgi:hypothetical protein
MGVIVDDARSHVFPGPVNHDRIGRCINRCANRGDLAVLKKDRSVPDYRPCGRENADIADYGRP